MIGAKGSDTREFAVRVAMALVLAPLGIWSVLLGGVVLKIITTAVGLAAVFEWARMSCGAETRSRTAILAIGAAGVATAIWASGGSLGLVILISLVAGAAAAPVASFGATTATSASLGVVYTTLPFGAFVWLREAIVGGEWLALGLLGIVWATDIAAYFAGRGFGGPLLSPIDSPNKTWTGAIGALICACLTGAAAARAFQAPVEVWVAVGALLSLVAQAGDLLESRLKRRYQVKDTSGFIPGHGGVLDRLDALMAAAIIFAVLIWLVPSASKTLLGAYA